MSETSDKTKAFSGFLNDELTRLGWTGGEVVRQMKRIDPADAVSVSTVSAWRRGEYLPKREHIPLLAKVIGASEGKLWSLIEQGDLSLAQADAATQIARELPATIQPHEVRLVLELLRGNLQALHHYNQGEDERHRVAAGVVLQTSQNSDESNASPETPAKPVQGVLQQG